ncbi:short-chain dehydrogenase/reductase sdr [Pyrenophora tritici-repentis]|nr:short-chain dehydrogenase/reductase sdr [Pyrenophora tritici-repentis]
MASTILITGANGSLAIPAVEYLLRAYPQHSLVLTVRNDSVKDHNTAELRRILAQQPDAHVSIRVLDLASLEQVRVFSDTILSEINDKALPRLSSVICNAMTWNLSGGPKYTSDGYEASIAVNYLAHFSLCLRLLSGMDNRASPEAIQPRYRKSWTCWCIRNQTNKAKKQGEASRDMELVTIMVMYELNRRLKAKKDTEAIRAVAVDPLDLLDSRAFRQPHVPHHLQIMARIVTWLLPLLRFVVPRLMKVEQAAGSVVEVAVAEKFSGQEGYFEGEQKVNSSPESMEMKMQLALWRKSVEWCGLEQGETIVEL